MATRKLIVVTGPTASGKTAYAINLAQRLGCDILSADSRQIYRGLPIGTAAPTPDELARVRHHFVGMLDLDEPYSAAQYEADALRLLDELWQQSPVQVMCGGSMMYIDAVTSGMDDLPDISPEVRARAAAIYANEGIEGVRATLLRLDPMHYNVVDRNNHKRMVHAIEISLEAGVPYSSLLTGRKKRRDFRIYKFAFDYPREQLFDRINRRVDSMVAAGLEFEARNVYALRHLNALNTVGYKEMFAYFDGLMSLDTAIARIGKNTRVYAKKQLTWMKRCDDIHYLDPNRSIPHNIESIKSVIQYE